MNPIITNRGVVTAHLSRSGVAVPGRPGAPLSSRAVAQRAPKADDSDKLKDKKKGDEKNDDTKEEGRDEETKDAEKGGAMTKDGLHSMIETLFG